MNQYRRTNLRPLSRLLCNSCYVPFAAPKRSHERSYADSAHHVDRYASFLDSLDHTHMCGTSSSTATQNQAD